jgi:hypothetical protein
MLQAMVVMDPPMVGTITLNGPADDEEDRGLCHYWVDGRLLCGAPVAPGRRGLHRGSADGNRECTGCGRPRCPTCERLRRERG